jgi:3-methyladenine DNA glycosylase/8-oxoguanine DNA glycosylase
MLLRAVNPFSLHDLAFSHGWIALSPWSWEHDLPAIRRIERLPDGTVVSLRIEADDPLAVTDTLTLRITPEVGVEESAMLERRVRWMLRLDEDLAPLQALLGSLEGCERPVSRGEGRLLRSWDFFEDAIKTICTTNTTWAQTCRIVARMVDGYGEPGPHGAAFPTPERLAVIPEDELREYGLGYRAGAVRALARAVAEGELPRDAAAWAMLPSEALQERLLAIRGVGPYAAANLRMLLGQYDRLAIDSWLRRAVREAWFDGASATDQEIEARFTAFGPWRALVYWFHPALHPARDTWREKAGEPVPGTKKEALLPVARPSAVTYRLRKEN